MGREIRILGAEQRYRRFSAYRSANRPDALPRLDRSTDVIRYPEPHVEKWHLGVRIGFVLGSASLCWALIVEAVSFIHTAIG